MSDKDVLARIEEQVTELTRLHSIKHEDHIQHHEFISQLIQREKERKECLAEIRKTIAAGGAWAVVCGLGAFVIWAIKVWIKMQ